MEDMIFPMGSVPVSVAAKVYGSHGHTKLNEKFH